MKKVLNKISALVVLLALLLFTGNVFAIDDFSGNTNLSVAIDTEKVTTLSADITAVATSIDVVDGSALVVGLALIEDEIVDITNITVNNLTVTRGETHSAAGSVATTASLHTAETEIRNINQDLIVSFTPTTDLILADEIIVSVPDIFGSIGTIEDTGALQSLGPVDYTYTDTQSGRDHIVELTQAGGVGVEYELSIDSVELPELEGQYSISLEVRDSDGNLLEIGSAVLSWANNVLVTVFVQPALLMSLDKTSIDITANPSVNSGEDFSQYSIIDVATNANSGYIIQASLDGTEVAAAQLDGAGTTGIIASGDALAAENVFGYIAYNGDGSDADGVNLTTNATAADPSTETNEGAQSFANAAATLVSSDTSDTDIGTLGFSSLTNQALHTIFYMLNVDFTIPSDQYEGILTYTAVPSF